MSNNSSIEWTETTWNPLAGCTRASAGCDNCYAAKMSLRLEAMAQADIAAGRDPGGKRKYMGIATKNGRGVPVFNGTINLDYDELQRPYRWKKPRLVFVNSMSDLFHKDVPDRFIVDVFNVMHDSPAHTFQVLTKRPERAASWARKAWGVMPDNVWIGTSVEDKENLWRIDRLRTIRAAVLFLSLEPLLADLGKVNLTGIHWVIVGGESGPNARPMHPDWARSLRDQCQAAGVSYFFKQWGEWSLIQKDTPLIYKGEDTGELHDVRKKSDFGCLAPDGEWFHQHTGWNGRPIDPDTGEAYMVKVGKKAAGRLLDGREWNEMPEAAAVYGTAFEGGDAIEPLSK